MSNRACLDCGTTLLTPPRKGVTRTGYCRSCNPKHKWSPQARANASAARKARWERELAAPGAREALSERGKWLRATFPQGPEVVARQIASRRARHWLPEGYEKMNAQLKGKGYLAAERRVIIEKHVETERARIAVEERARLAALPALERQLERVRNGAKLVAAFKPQGNDYAYSLTGSSL